MKMFLQAHKRSLLIAGIVFLLAFIVIWKYVHRTPTIVPDSVLVEADKVKVGNIEILAQAVGTLTASKNIDLVTEMPGQISNLFFHDGQPVKEKTPLIQLDDKVLRAKAESSKASLFLSDANYKRMVYLKKKGAMSQQAVETAYADLKEKESIAKEMLINLNKMQISAPFSGMLGKCRVNVGDFVQAGQVLITLTDIDNLRVEYNVSEKYLPQLKIGQQVTLTTSTYPGKTFYGKVAFISPTVDPAERTISVYADVPNQNHQLTSGLFVNVTQYLGQKKDAVLISAKSLIPTIDGQMVYKIIDNKLVKSPIEIGYRTNELVQILKGVSAADVVVTAGQQKCKEGAPVRIKS